MELLPLRNLKSMQRFIKKTQFLDGCVEWQSTRAEGGYGAIKINKKVYMAHRISWAWANSLEIHQGLKICHSCDNPKCVNPEHLWLGTATDNYNDMISKGRGTIFKGHERNIGAKNPFAKLDEHKVREIKAMLAQKVTCEVIAKIYGVHACSISRIQTGKQWNHVT